MPEDPFGGLNADEWRRGLKGLESQIGQMRSEAAALESELRSGRRSMKDIQAEARRGASIGGAAAARGGVSPAAEAAAGRRAARNARTIAQHEAKAAASRAASVKSMQRLAALRVAPIALAGGGGVLAPPGVPPSRRLPPGEPPRGPVPPSRQLPPGGGRAPVALLPAPGQTFGSTAKQAETAAEGIRGYERAATGATGANKAFSSNLQRNQAVLAASSREMRKFGALTTEFISAAGRGAVTVRELGYQVTATIGKFGGWLIAGSAVFTAFGAIRAVGKGAIEAEDGVAELQRVVDNLDASQATASFRELAREFNLPIEEVTKAAFEMGKIFHDQNETLEATRTILSSVKVGELDVAASSRFLTSIIVAFKLPVEEMATVFDQVNEAQNRFGIQIQDTLSGLAKAAGTFKAAGGDISSLLAILVTARRATGRTGEEIGTAIARVPNFLRQPKARGVLRSFGIDPEEDITQVFEEAFEKTQKIGGRESQELAASIFGPRFGAKIGTPLFQQLDLYNKALKDTSPEASKGSAEEELQDVLSKTGEEMREVIVQLETLGSGLADAGFLAPFFALLKLLNSTLSLANSLVDVFNELPEPLKLAVSSFAQIVGFIAVMRRFNVGESFGGRGAGVAGTLFTRRNQEAFRLREAFLGQQDELAAEAESTAQTSVKRSLDVEAARATVSQEKAALASTQRRASEGELGATEAVADQETKVAQSQGLLVSAREAELDAMNKNKAVLRRSLFVQSNLAQITKKTTDEHARVIARGAGVRIPPRIGANLGTAGELADPQLQRELAPEILRAQNAFIGSELRAHQIEPRTLKTRLRTLTQNMRSYGALGGVMHTANTGLRSSFRRARGALGRVRLASVGRIAGSFKKAAGNAARQIAGFFGPVEAFLIGAFLIFQEIKKGLSTVKEIGETLEEEPESFEAFKEQQDRLQEFAEEGSSILDRFVLGQHAAVGEAIEGIEQTSRERTNQLLALLRGDKLEDTSTLFVEDFEKSGLDPLVNQFKDGTITAVELARRANNLVRSVKEAQNLSEEEEAELIRDIRTTTVEVQGIKAGFTQIAALTTDDLGKRVSDYAEAVSSGIGTLAQRQQLLKDTLVFAADRFGSQKPEDIAGISEALDGLTSAITEAAQTELDRSLLFATSQEERNAAYDEYIRATSPELLRSQAQKLIREQQERLKQNDRVQLQLLQDLRRGEVDVTDRSAGALRRVLDQIAPGLTGFIDKTPLGKLLPVNYQVIIEELEKRGKDTKEVQERIRNIRKALGEAIKRHNFIIEQVRRQRFEENQALLKARTDLRAGQAPEGLASTRIQLKSIATIIDRAIEVYGRDSKEVLDLLSEQQSLRDEAIEEQASLLQARTDFRAAEFSGEGEEKQRAKVELEGLRAQLAFAEAHRAQFSEVDILQLRTQIREAEAELAQQSEDRAKELKLALLDVRIARARGQGFDVRAARAELAKAMIEFRNAEGPVERRQAQAEIINQRASLRESIYRREIEDIQFGADIGKLTLQQQISQYQQLLKTLNLNRDQRRDLRRRIHNLKEESEDTDEFALRVGDIQLPTIYDIRRAVRGGLDQRPRLAFQDNSNTEVNVSVDGGNPQELFRVMDNAVNRRNRNARRSAGLTP